MNTSIVYDQHTDSLARTASKKLTELISQNSKLPILLMLSGGSALQLLTEINTQNLNDTITCCVLDERYSNDKNVNNYALVQKTHFYKDAEKKGVTFIDTDPAENESINDLAERFDQSIKKWKRSNPSGVIIATMGIGPDGHTSGIMPFPENQELFKELFENENRWVVGYDAGSKNQYPLRVTTTISFLKRIDYAVVFATGENKKEVLRKALSKESILNQVPSNVVQAMKHVTIFTDQKI